MLQFLVDILPLGSGYVDPHIFADPDSGSQNLGDPTDPDPKHCLEHEQVPTIYVSVYLCICIFDFCNLPNFDLSPGC